MNVAGCLPSVTTVCAGYRSDGDLIQRFARRQVRWYMILMISSFSDVGYLIRRLTHPRSCFSKQSDLECLFADDLLRRGGLAAQAFHLVGGCSVGSVARQTALASLE